MLTASVVAVHGFLLSVAICANGEATTIKFEVGKRSIKKGVVDSLYESKVTISRKDLKSPIELRGSVFPDNISMHGRIVDGEYSVHLGFHKRSESGKPLVPSADDLIVKTKGTLRPCLVVNRDKPVSCSSDDPKKTQMEAIHIHNGFRSETGSEGCLTIHPDDWDKFIKCFLNSHDNLSDWYADGQYFGVHVGTLKVETP